MENTDIELIWTKLPAIIDSFYGKVYLKIIKTPIGTYGGYFDEKHNSCYGRSGKSLYEALNELLEWYNNKGYLKPDDSPVNLAK